MYSELQEHGYPMCNVVVDIMVIMINYSDFMRNKGLEENIRVGLKMKKYFFY